jgi:hypothetical protein
MDRRQPPEALQVRRAAAGQESEPASILHELVWHRNYGAMQFLIDRGIDMTIRDHRWNATAQGWAEYAATDAKLAEWLGEAERQRELRR